MVKIKNLVPVKNLATEGDYSMVEYYSSGDLHRASVENSKIEIGDQGAQVDIKILNAAIKFGIDWDQEFPGLNNLNWEMHRRGIWTFEDARAKSAEARKAVMAATGKIIQKILEGGQP